MTKTVIGLTVFAVVACTTACGGNGSSGAPTAPSLTTEIGAQSLSSTVSQLDALGKGRSGSAKPDGKNENRGNTPNDGDNSGNENNAGSENSGNNGNSGKVELEGVIASVAAGAIVVGGTSVTIPADVVIRHGGMMLGPADLTIGDRVHVRGTRTGPIVMASEIMVQRDADGGALGGRVSGLVAGLAGACPAMTFTVGGTTVSTTSTTRFSGGTCAELANGMAAHVAGMLQSDGSLLALRVALEDEDAEASDVDGVLANLQGTCPALTFTVGTITVSTSSTTRFSDSACAQLANGMTAEVKAVLQSDGSLLALKVSIEDDDVEGAKVDGTIATLQGTCPAITFTIGTITVLTDSATRFRDGVCAQALNGTQVEVKGIALSDGSIQAVRIWFEDVLDDLEFE